MLHIVNKSPLSNNMLDACLRIAPSGDILLIEDAVYAAIKGGATEARLREAMARFKIHALLSDLEARGLADRIIEGIVTVDYAGFVDLVSACKNCQSWL